MNDWCFLGFLCENFLFSFAPCLMFSPWLTRSSPWRTLLLICKAWKEMSSWMATSLTREASGNNYNCIAVYKKDMDCGNRPAGNTRRQEIQKPQQKGLILLSEILLSLKMLLHCCSGKKTKDDKVRLEMRNDTGLWRLWEMEVHYRNCTFPHTVTCAEAYTCMSGTLHTITQ